MTSILIDSSVWIGFFRGDESVRDVSNLIELNQICTNNLILAELVPALHQKKENHLIELLNSIRNIPIEINWKEIIKYQEMNLHHGLNHIGIPDLIILQNTINNELFLYSLDKHFELMSKFVEFGLYTKKE